jgi:uncharacterized protein involved in cysteine biosynthesis
VIEAFAKAFEQLSDPQMRRLIWLTIGVSLAALAAAWGGVSYFLTETHFFQIGWLDTAIDVLGGLAVAALTVIFFPSVVSAVAGLFLDDVADQVERRHFRQLPPPRRQDPREQLISSVKFFGVLIFLNILLLFGLLAGPVYPFLFYAVNGYLLGREYFEVAALRRDQPPTVTAIRRRHRGQLFVAGVVIAILFTVPLLNLLAPMIATAAMVHTYHRLKARG